MMTSDAPEEKNILKILWEKEKMLVTSIFSFLHNFFSLRKDNFNRNNLYVICKINAYNLKKKTKKFIDKVKG